MMLERDGAVHFIGAALYALPELLALSENLPEDQAGVRLHGRADLREIFLENSPMMSLVKNVLGSDARPVRALMFDKSAKTNWALGWHQDRTICVRERRDAPGFGPWTVKSGQHHVEPPTDLLSHMVTMRVHLDEVAADNGPLLIAPGSHYMGRIAEQDIPNVIQKSRSFACLAAAGDIWLYRTLILHASDRAVNPRRRRVLQMDFSAQELPFGLEWTGI